MSIITIAGDPTTWHLAADVDVQAIRQDLVARSGPVAMGVIAPLSGRLLLSTQSAGYAIPLTEPHGWIPGGADYPATLIYVPTATGPTATSQGYALPPSIDPVGLEMEILSAMANGTTLAVDIVGSFLGGGLVLNGSTLPFVVLCPATTSST
jgi:hypothetical protein